MSLRVFCEQVLACESRATLDPDESHYLVRVRRALPGASLEVFDGRGGLWRARVTRSDAGAAEIEIERAVPVPSRIAEVELVLGMPDSKTALDVIARACEVGAARVTLARCQRSQPGHPSTQRVLKVVRSAQRQCGRPTPPVVVGPMPLPKALEAGHGTSGFFAWESLRGRPSSPARIDAEASVRLLIGPEGGLTEGEVELARRSGLVPIALGPWTLRTGTAALVGLGWLMGVRAPA